MSEIISLKEFAEKKKGKKKLTFCTECKNLIIEGDARRWYDRFCKAMENEKGIDMFDGSECYFTVNDLGKKLATEERFAHPVNNGNCASFQPKEEGSASLFEKQKNGQ